jgi:hypothetical protein
VREFYKVPGIVNGGRDLDALLGKCPFVVDVGNGSQGSFLLCKYIFPLYYNIFTTM